MKTILLAIACLLCIAKSKAQTSNSISGLNKNRGYIGISLGEVSATGRFERVDSNNTFSGNASKGYNLNFLTVGIGITKRFMIVGNWGGGFIGVKEKRFAERWKNSETATYLIDIKRGWTYGNIMLGVGYTIPRKRFNLDFRAMAGRIVLISPEMTIYKEDKGIKSEIRQEAQLAQQYGGSFGVQLRYKPTNKIFIGIAGDYMVSKRFEFDPKFYAGNRYLGKAEMETPFEVVNFTINLGFQLK